MKVGDTGLYAHFLWKAPQKDFQTDCFFYNLKSIYSHVNLIPLVIEHISVLFQERSLVVFVQIGL